MNLRTVSLWVVLSDQASKFLIVRFLHLDQSVTLIRGFLYLTYVLNPGAAFGFMADSRAIFRIPFFIAITVIASVFVYGYQRFVPREKAWVRFALGLIWGGAMGNFVDRIFYRKVVDFINFQIAFSFHQWLPFVGGQTVDRIHATVPAVSVQTWYQTRQLFPWVFNVADSCITVGLAILLLNYWAGGERKPAKGAY